MRNVTSWTLQKLNEIVCVCAIKEMVAFNLFYALQDFARHFHVLLPEGTNQASQEALRQYLSQVDLTPEGFQVGCTMVRSTSGSDRT